MPWRRSLSRCRSGSEPKRRLLCFFLSTRQSEKSRPHTPFRRDENKHELRPRKGGRSCWPRDLLGRRFSCGQKLHRAARALDRSDRPLGGGGDLECELGGKRALAEDLHAVARLGDHAGGKQRVLGHDGRGVELARVDGLLNAAEVDLIVIRRKRIVEAALRQATM